MLLPPAHNAAYLLSLGDDYALNYTKGLRAKGYTRAEEVEPCVCARVCVARTRRRNLL